jgi:hypothetical protein
MFKRFSAWWHDDTMTGRDGVRINKHPRISANGVLYWNVRDIIFKPCSTNDTKGKQ